MGWRFVGLGKVEFGGKVVDCGGLMMEVEGCEGVRIDAGFGEGLGIEL